MISIPKKYTFENFKILRPNSLRKSKEVLFKTFCGFQPSYNKTQKDAFGLEIEKDVSSFVLTERELFVKNYEFLKRQTSSDRKKGS